MATEAGMKESSGKQAEGSTGTYAILFEIENVAAGGRPATFNAVKKALGDVSAKLTPSDFARHALQPSPDMYMETLLQVTDAKDASADKVAATAKESLSDYFQSKAELDPGLSKLAQAAKSRDVAIGVISGLSDEASEQLMTKLQLSATGAKMLVVKDLEKGYPRADSWLKVAKQINRAPRNCIVVTSCQTACKSALNAGMRCIVVTDEYTSHQDFSGADLVLDNWEEMSAKDILDALMPDA
ncbi:MAG: HAD hydrolase-like protein [bacterium]